MQSSSNLLCARFFYSQIRRMLILTTCALLMFSIPAYAQERDCNIDDVTFPNDSFFDAVDAVSSSATSRPDMPLLWSKLSFDGPRPDPDHKYEHRIYDAILTMQFDATKVRTDWESEVRSRLTDVGCSSQTVHSFSTNVADPDGVHRGILHGYFHVRYQNRACGDWPWPMHGGWATDKFRIETDVWQDFTLSITGDNHITVGMSGHAQDNVTQFERDLASIVGNLFALCPITGGLILGFDKAVFEGLKAERDALDEAGKFQIVRDEKVGGSDADDNYNFPLTAAEFDDAQGKLVITIVAKQTSISRTHACKIRQNLSNEQIQGANLKTAQNYTVKLNDSAWSVAKEMYGEGRYYWFVAGLNNLTPSAANQLRPGQVLRLESLGSFLRAGGRVMVARRDSFWRISQGQKSTTGTKYSDLLNANRIRFPIPDSIFPLQVIDYPKKP